MKKLKKILIVLLCLVMFQIPETAVTGLVSAQAAANPGLRGYTKTVTVNGKQYKKKMYYYVNADGTRVKSSWKNVGKYRYYFDSKGYAVTAYVPTDKAVRLGQTIGIVNQKIKSKFYGFDQFGHMLKGIYAVADIENPTKTSFAVYDTQSGVYDYNLSKKLRNASVSEKDSKTLRNLLKAEKIIKTKEGYSCYPKMPDGTDLIVTYDHYVVNYCKDKTGTKEVVLGVTSR